MFTSLSWDIEITDYPYYPDGTLLDKYWVKRVNRDPGVQSLWKVIEFNVNVLDPNESTIVLTTTRMTKLFPGVVPSVYKRTLDYETFKSEYKQAQNDRRAKEEKKVDKKELVEDLSEIEHEQWEEWSKEVSEDIEDKDRIKRWKKLWKPYDKLKNKDKEDDREWADQVLDVLEDHGVKISKLAWVSPEYTFETEVHEDFIRDIYDMRPSEDVWDKIDEIVKKYNVAIVDFENDPEMMSADIIDITLQGMAENIAKVLVMLKGGKYKEMLEWVREDGNEV